jgi:hypothetical protein
MGDGEPEHAGGDRAGRTVVPRHYRELWVRGGVEAG